MKHLEQDELALHYFGDDAPAEHAAAEVHLKECAACRADFEALSLTLATVREAQPVVPERPANYEEQVWNSIRAHLPRHADKPEKKQWWAWIAQPRQWAIAGAVAVIVVAAFLAGRFSNKQNPQQPNANVATNNAASGPQVQGPQPQTPTNPTPTPDTGNQQAPHVASNAGPRRPNAGDNAAVAVNAPQQKIVTRDRILLVAVGDHLERSQMVLMELVNAAPDKGGEVNIASEQQRAQDLVNSNRLYRMTAQDVGDRKLANVLDELERMLVEIAHEPAKVNSEELKDLQRRIEAQGLLFKVRVVGANIRDQKKPGPKSGAAKKPGVTEKRQNI